MSSSVLSNHDRGPPNNLSLAFLRSVRAARASFERATSGKYVSPYGEERNRRKGTTTYYGEAAPEPEAHGAAPEPEAGTPTAE